MSSKKKADEIIRLDITRGKELELVSNQNIADKDSLMHHAYESALRAVKDIIISSNTWNGKYSIDNNFDDLVNSLYGYSNNIVAFCGKRGQGKTSAMLSFSSALKDYQYRDTSTEDHRCKSLQDSRFCVFPPIDPTTKNDAILAVELILSRLLEKINQCWAKEERSTLNSEYGKSEILKAFSECMDGLNSKKRAEDDDISMIQRLSRSKDIFCIKANILKIVKYYLDISQYGSRNGFVIIQLDDADMQFSCAYEILEEVRKYLSIPNVIVLMSVDIEQLRDLITLRNAKALESKDGTKDASAMRLATKYLDKLIPATHAIHLPTIKSKYEINSGIRLRIHDDKDEGDTNDTLENVIYDLIYKKTGLVFIKHESYINDIIPSTLRGVVQLYNLLDRMEMPASYSDMRKTIGDNVNGILDYYNERKQSDTIRLINLELFEDYFLRDWIPSKLSPQHHDIFNELETVHINRKLEYAMYKLSKMLEESKEKGIINDDAGLWPLSGINYFCFLQKTLSLPCIEDIDFRFVFAMKTYISIQLNKITLKGEINRILEINNNNEENEDIITYEPQKTYNKLFGMLLGNSLTYEQEKIILDEMGIWPDATNANQIIGGTLIEKLKSTLKDIVKKSKTPNTGKDDLHRAVIQEIKCFVYLLFFLDAPLNKPALSIVAKRYFALNDFLLYVICNWDVQHQLFNMVITKYRNDSTVNPEEPEKLLNYFLEVLCKKDAVGGYDDIIIELGGRDDMYRSFIEEFLRNIFPASKIDKNGIKDSIQGIAAEQSEKTDEGRFDDPKESDDWKTIGVSVYEAEQAKQSSKHEFDDAKDGIDRK